MFLFLNACKHPPVCVCVCVCVCVYFDEKITQEQVKRTSHTFDYIPGQSLNFHFPIFLHCKVEI